MPTATELLMQRLRQPRENNTARIISALSAVASPNVREGLQQYLKPELATISPEEERLMMAAKYEDAEASRALKERLAALKARESVNKAGNLQLTKGQEARDRKFGQEYADFINKGGFAGLEKKINQLEFAAQELDKGGISGPVEGLVPDFIKAATDPRALEVQRGVEQVVQESLKQILGAQFTEKEGERLLQRTFDPKLPDAVNARTVRRTLTQLRQLAAEKQAAAQHFEQFGTMEGFRGRAPNIESNKQAAKPSTGRVRVVSPDGKTGTIPASQLQDALAAGYVEAE